MMDAMTPNNLLRASAFLSTLVLAQGASAQAARDPVIRLDSTGSRAIEVANLGDPEGCVSSTDVGRITKRHFEKGQLTAVTFKDATYESYLNLPGAYEFKTPQTARRVSDALSALLVTGVDLRIKAVACGAAGRIVHLEAAALAKPPAPQQTAATEPMPQTTEPDRVLLQAPGQDQETPRGVWVEEKPQGRASLAAARPVPRATKWTIAPSNRFQLHIEITSIDRAFEWSISCSRAKSGAVAISNWFLGPRNWNSESTSPRIAIDGDKMAWEIDGADEGIVLSDSVQGNTITLSRAALAKLASGERFVVGGKTNRGRPHDAVFDISGGQAAFADFEARCRRLPPS